MIIEFKQTYSQKTPIEKVISQNVCGKVNTIKFVRESTAAVPEIENQRIEFIVDGEIYDLAKIEPCKIKHHKIEDTGRTQYRSEVSDKEIDGVTMTIFEIFEKLSTWLKEEE